MSDGKCIVKYLRLSLEDEDMLDESNSITNQRIVIGQYIASKNVCLLYTSDAADE